MQRDTTYPALARPVRLIGYNAGLRAGGISNYISHLHAHLSEIGVGDQIRGSEVRQFVRITPYNTDELVHNPMIMGSQVLLTGRYPRSVVTVHDLGGLLSPLDRASMQLSHKILLRFALRGVQRAKQIIAVSDYTKQMLVQHLTINPERISVTYEAASDLFHPRSQTETRMWLADQYGLVLPKDQPVLLYVGSELPRKNLGVLWAALTSIRQHYPAARVLKVGKAGGQINQRDVTMRALKTHSVMDAVTFLDSVDVTMLARLYNVADVFVQPSLYEGFSLPTVEAMASGCPVVAADATCLPEVVGDAGSFFDPFSPVELADHVLRVFEDARCRRELSERGQRRAAMFDWNETARRTLQLYNQA